MKTITLTPMLKQYYTLKAKVEDAILFFRMGDFYEVFGDDSKKIAPVLALVLTSRDRGDQEKIPFCGVPHHSAKSYWLKLLRQGYKVAIADQLEAASASKGLVKRDIVRILSPGCIDDLEGLESCEPNYIMALYEDIDSRQYLLLVTDVSTGEMRLGSIEFSELGKYINSFRPKEILARKFVHIKLKKYLAALHSAHSILLGVLPEFILKDPTCQTKLLQKVFQTSRLDNFSCGKLSGSAALVSSVLTYFEHLQTCTGQFMEILPLTDPETMLLGENVVRDLELLSTLRRNTLAGSLFHKLNDTMTSMGARFLHHVLLHPMRNMEKIASRHQQIADIQLLGLAFQQTLRKHLGGLSDIERLLTRVLAKNLTPQELWKLIFSLQQTLTLFEYLLKKKDKGTLAKSFPGYQKIQETKTYLQCFVLELEKEIQENPEFFPKSSGVFCRGFDETLDRYYQLATNAHEAVIALENKLRETTGIQSLKIKRHKSLGLLIEVTKSNAHKVPETFMKRQTMINHDRFITMELEEIGHQIADAQESFIAREEKLYAHFLNKLSTHKEPLKILIKDIRQIDLVQCFSWTAGKFNYVQPILSENPRKIVLEGARHPVIEHYVGQDKFMANNLLLDGSQRHLLITGPNMAGKSTIMRQTAVIAIMTQMGSFVPANKAILPVFDQIFTRVGASDDLVGGVSTFMLEMQEAAQILRKATDKSLVIIDEVGRGTSTQDGLAIAFSILENLSLHMACFTLFATHYHELVTLSSKLPAVVPMQIEVLQKKGEQIIFSHRLIPGCSGHSYGIEVAKVAGIPPRVIERAQQFIDEYIKLHPQTLSHTQINDLPLEERGLQHIKKYPKQQQSEWLVEKLAKYNPERTTPLQALRLLYEIKSELKTPKKKELFQY